MKVLAGDFETRSLANLPKTGAHKYMMDRSTGLYMLGWAIKEADAPPLTIDQVNIWLPGQPVPEEIIEHIEREDIIKAWNAQFERLGMWYVMCPDFDVPEPRYDQFRCTAAQARAHGLPGSLGDCARALGLPELKQAEGTRLIQTYSVKNVPWEEIPPDDQELFIEYCKQDVVVEDMISCCLRELTDHEWDEYALNEEICDRGVPLDVDFAVAALDYAEDVRADVDARIRKLTGGEVKNARARKTRDVWLLPQLTEGHIDLLTEYVSGEKKMKFDQRHRGYLLEADDLAPEVREYIELVEEAGGATISKYSAMVQREIDGRLMGALLFNGAGQTGRFSSMGIQLHNLKRPGKDDPDPEPLIQLVKDGYEIEDVTKTLAKLVRSAIYRSEGLTWVDFSAIEGRVAPWAADSPEGDAKLDLYRKGVDPYVYNAAATYDIPMEAVDKEQRQAGKIQELSLQFLGGVGALRVMAANHGMSIPEAQAKMLRDKWRQANPWAQKFGRQLERATFAAMKNPGGWCPAGRVDYAYDGGDWLWCRLPSGRVLAYYQPRIEVVETPWGDERRAITCLWGARRPKKGQPWTRRAMRDGLWLENLTQAIAADLLREALLRCDDAGLKVVLHVHDEIIAEGHVVDELKACMLEAPVWADGLPLDGAGGSGERYGK